MPKLKLSNNAIKILEKRYLKKDDNGKVIEKPEDLFKRVANNIALADAKYLLKEEINNLEINQEYFELVKTKEFQKLLKKNPKVRKKIEKTEQEFYNLMTSLDFLPNSPTLFNAGRDLHGWIPSCGHASSSAFCHTSPLGASNVALVYA